MLSVDVTNYLNDKQVPHVSLMSDSNFVLLTYYKLIASTSTGLKWRLCLLLRLPVAMVNSCIGIPLEFISFTMHVLNCDQLFWNQKLRVRLRVCGIDLWWWPNSCEHQLFRNWYSYNKTMHIVLSHILKECYLMVQRRRQLTDIADAICQQMSLNSWAVQPIYQQSPYQKTVTQHLSSEE